MIFKFYYLYLYLGRPDLFGSQYHYFLKRFSHKYIQNSQASLKKNGQTFEELEE
jgi:hypothetical protein